MLNLLKIEGKMLRRKRKMENLTTVAVAKAVSDKTKNYKAARGALEAGSHAINTTVKLVGSIEIAEDTNKTSTCSLLNEDFLALVLHHAGVTRKSAAAAIEKVAAECLEGWTGSKEDKKAAKEVRAEAVAKFDPNGEIKAIFAGIKDRLPRTPVKGSVKFVGEVIEIEEEVEEIKPALSIVRVA